VWSRSTVLSTREGKFLEPVQISVRRERQGNTFWPAECEDLDAEENRQN
jgi:hypothetical protein